MADTIIKLLDQSFEEEFFKFELDNRSYFDKIGFPRADSYYDFNKFKTIINLTFVGDWNKIKFYTLLDELF